MIKILVLTIGFQGIFYLFYRILLSKETFYTLNRFYLLTTSFLAILIPFIPKIYSPFNGFASGIIPLPEVLITWQHNDFSIVSSSFPMVGFSILVWIYLLGVAGMSLLFVRKFYKLYHLIKKGRKERKKTFVLVYIPDSSSIFSFLHYIFLGDQVVQKEAILTHEMVHINHKHSWDLLWFEFQKIIFWFNPFPYLYQRNISMLHEFIADKETLKHEDKQYINYLLNAVFHVEDVSFINQFYHNSFLKKRIIMMTKNNSSAWKQVKYVAVIPLLVVMLFSCSQTEQKPNVQTIPDVQVTIDGVPFSSVDQVPIYPGCESLTNQEEQKKCFSKSIQQFVAQKFNIKLAQTLDLKPGKKRIFVLFYIDSNGNITKVKARAPHKKLEEEAKRVVKLLPKMTPGMENGTRVTVKYALPITFVVEE